MWQFERDAPRETKCWAEQAFFNAMVAVSDLESLQPKLFNSKSPQIVTLGRVHVPTKILDKFTNEKAIQLPIQVAESVLYNSNGLDVISLYW